MREYHINRVNAAYSQHIAHADSMQGVSGNILL